MKAIKYNTLMKLCLVVLFLSTVSCKKFLDLRPDKKQVIPKTLDDCQAILDNYQTMNALYPSDGEFAADNYYMLAENWQAMSYQQDRDTYTWNPSGEHLTTQWLYAYKVVYNANLVLQVLNKLKPSVGETPKWEQIKGAALFFRAYAFYQIAQIFSAPYDERTASELPGIPIRLDPDLTITSTRGTIAETYDQILSDFKTAITLLPLNTSLQSRPDKASAYAAMARTYLTMENYKQAGEMADACLKLKNKLLDYNNINITGSSPFNQFNEEVIFQAVSAPKDAFGYGKVDSVLMASYNVNDLRRKAFFSDYGNGTYVFKGNYNGFTYSSEFFGGFATDEVYLIRAECYARNGDTDLALMDLDKLLKNRIGKDSYEPFITTSAEIALYKIIEERRKELIFRNLRWTDLRRLNKDPRFAITLKRKLTFEGIDKTYNLLPNDLRYTFLIPFDVMSTTNFVQNLR